MKLIDILARELQVWPKKATHAYSSGQLCRFSDSGVTIDQWLGISEEPEDSAYAHVTRAEWQVAVDALKAEKCDHIHGNDQGCPECGEEFSPAWNGIGQPPVGCEIEALLPALGSSRFWQAAKVVHGPLPESPTKFWCSVWKTPSRAGLISSALSALLSRSRRKSGKMPFKIWQMS